MTELENKINRILFSYERAEAVKKIAKLLQNTAKRVVGIHSKQSCLGPCPFHSPSKHHMIRWEKNIRYDRGCLVERICKHGIGHPDPDSLKWINKIGLKDSGVHGCDGCCARKKP
jgi:hypothetical protein